MKEFLDREWKLVNESVFGRHDPAVWDARRPALAAHDAGRIVGAASFKIEAGLGKLSRFVTAADQRGQGVGGALLVEFEGVCRREGRPKVGLKTYWNSEAQRFYE